MGVHRHPGTLSDGLTPICNECGISLCWDISIYDYAEEKQFWDAWICEICNGGVPFNREFFRSLQASGPRLPT